MAQAMPRVRCTASRPDAMARHSGAMASLHDLKLVDLFDARVASWVRGRRLLSGDAGCQHVSFRVCDGFDRACALGAPPFGGNARRRVASPRLLPEKEFACFRIAQVGFALFECRMISFPTALPTECPFCNGYYRASYSRLSALRAVPRSRVGFRSWRFCVVLKADNLVQNNTPADAEG